MAWRTGSERLSGCGKIQDLSLRACPREAGARPNRGGRSNLGFPTGKTRLREKTAGINFAPVGHSQRREIFSVGWNKKNITIAVERNHGDD
jgi:hypothetical protein